MEFGKAEREIFHFVLDHEFTRVSPQRLIATINACKHAALAGTDGDFVECGVWRGGNAIAAKMIFEHYQCDKTVWLFDTYTGMSEPTDEDRSARSGKAARNKYLREQKGDHNAWCFASLEDVQRNVEKSGVDMSGVRFVKGDVAQTLTNGADLPGSISVLRLDTDWYASTKIEMEILYPRLSSGGSLLIDDFGQWEGARQAIEEYLVKLPAPEQPLLHYTDYTGRMGIKP